MRIFDWTVFKFKLEFRVAQDSKFTRIILEYLSDLYLFLFIWWILHNWPRRMSSVIYKKRFITGGKNINHRKCSKSWKIIQSAHRWYYNVIILVPFDRWLCLCWQNNSNCYDKSWEVGWKHHKLSGPVYVDKKILTARPRAERWDGNSTSL